MLLGEFWRIPLRTNPNFKLEPSTRFPATGPPSSCFPPLSHRYDRGNAVWESWFRCFAIGKFGMLGSTFVIAGGSHGMGLGIVQRLLDAGASVTVLSRTLGQLPAHERLTHITHDFASAEGLSVPLPERIEGLCYCPGSITLGSFRRLKPADLANDFQLNVTGAVTLLQAALPAMRAAKSSAMLMFSTVAVSQGLTMHSSVATVKGAVEGLTRSLAAELAPHIRVNCIAPAMVATPLSARFLASDEARTSMDAKYPLQRVGKVDDIAPLAQLLLSDEGSWITGQVISVDGGMSRVR